MPRISEFDDEMQQYFHTLPAFIQETIMQSDMELHSRTDLERCAEHLTQKRNCCK